MRQDYTDITVVLDRSGSMVSIREDMEGGFAEFLKEQKLQPGKCTLTLNQFDTVFENVYTGKDIRDVNSLTIAPRGGTALIDAIGRTINETGKRLEAMPEAERPFKVVVVIVTDGEENSSREFKSEDIKAMVALQESVYKWNFIYLGANQDAFSVAGNIGVSMGKAMNFTNDCAGEVFKNFSGKMTGIRSMSSGQYCQLSANNVSLYNDVDVIQLNEKVVDIDVVATS